MTLSTHKVEVVPIKLEKHPNADSLSVIHIFGYTVCVRTSDWKDGELGAYIVPDTLVDTRRNEFAFLVGAGSLYNEFYHRVRVKKLRGIISQGLLIKAPSFAKEGDDVAEYFGTVRYEAQEKTSTGGDFESGPLFYSKYDLDSFYRYSRLFVQDEYVYISEKIDGSNARFCFADGRMYCGSRAGWRKESDESIYWIALKKMPQIIEFCTTNQDCTLFGEVFGDNPKMPYSDKKKDIRFAAFDICHNGQWLGPIDRQNILNKYDILQAPVIHSSFKFDSEQIKQFAEGKTLFPVEHIREGCVVEPLIPRYDDHIGRVKLKIVGNDYMEKA